MRARLDTTFRSLRVRNYRLFATGQLVKLVGIWMQFTAQDWLVLQLSGNRPTALGAVTALQFTPVLLLTLYGGKLADRYDKRRLLIIANLGFALTAMLLGILVATGAARLWHVFVLALVTGVSSALETPVRQAFVSELVERELLPNALALSSATFNAARIVGPALSGLAISWLGLGPVFLANAALCIAPVVSTIRMRPGELYRGEPSRVTADQARIVDGLRYTWQRRDLVLPMVLVLVVGMLGFNFQVTLAVLAKNVFHADARSFGLLTTSLALGALCGALAGTGRRSRPSIYLVLAAAVVFGALEALVGLAPSFTVAAVVLVPTGFFMIFFAQAANQRVQLGVSRAFRGRVMALYILVFLGTTPLGAPVIGWCAEHFGPRSGIWVGGLASLVAALVIGALQLHRVGAEVRVHLKPRPHVHVWERADDGSPGLEVRLPAA